jgi:hypothetical protein
MSDIGNLGSSGASSDSLTETTSTSWLSRIGQSIKGVLLGLVLVIAAAVGLFWNEGRAVQTERSLDEGGSVVVDADTARVDPAGDGKLVHLTGDLKTSAKLTDPDFAVAAEGAKLLRTVEMYQWKEETRKETHKNLGGSEETTTTYSYVRTWSDTRIDSARFREASGHANPQMRFRRFQVTARDATLGAFRPGERVVGLLPTSRELRPEPAVADALRAKLGAVQVTDGRLYVGADPAEPRIGDLRIAFHVAPTGTVSLIGRQTGPDLTPYQTKAGDQLLMAKPGVVSAAEMFKAAEAENRILTWVLRLVAVIVMFLGFFLIFRPLAVVADVVPLFGSILGAGVGLVALLLTAILAPVVVAIAWLWYRPLVSVAVLVVGAAVVLGVRYMASRRTPRAPASAAPA